MPTCPPEGGPAGRPECSVLPGPIEQIMSANRKIFAAKALFERPKGESSLKARKKISLFG